MSVYRDIYEKISASQPLTLEAPYFRLLKLQEEAGEAAQAAVGFSGFNKRKAGAYTEEDVAKELADVVITAMVAMHDWVEFPEKFMKDRLQVLVERIKREGS